MVEQLSGKSPMGSGDHPVCCVSIEKGRLDENIEREKPTVSVLSVTVYLFIFVLVSFSLFKVVFSHCEVSIWQCLHDQLYLAMRSLIYRLRMRTYKVLLTTYRIRLQYWKKWSSPIRNKNHLLQKRYPVALYIDIFGRMCIVANNKWCAPYTLTLLHTRAHART